MVAVNDPELSPNSPEESLKSRASVPDSVGVNDPLTPSWIHPHSVDVPPGEQHALELLLLDDPPPPPPPPPPPVDDEDDDDEPAADDEDDEPLPPPLDDDDPPPELLLEPPLDELELLLLLLDDELELLDDDDDELFPLELLDVPDDDEYGPQTKILLTVSPASKSQPMLIEHGPALLLLPRLEINVIVAVAVEKSGIADSHPAASQNG
jgi:hypothetical protein